MLESHLKSQHLKFRHLNFFLIHHLILPNSEEMKATLKKLNRADSEKATEEDTMPTPMVKRLVRKLVLFWA